MKAIPYVLVLFVLLVISPGNVFAVGVPLNNSNVITEAEAERERRAVETKSAREQDKVFENEKNNGKPAEKPKDEIIIHVED